VRSSKVEVCSPLGAPWNLSVPTATDVLGIFGRPPQVDTVLMFHAVLRGALVLELGARRTPTLLEAGDLVLLDLREPHVIREGDGGACLNMRGIVGDHDFRQPLVFDAGPGAPGAKLSCGGFFLRNTALHPLLSSLPPVVKVTAGGRFDTVSLLLSLLASESEAPRMGSRAVVRRLSDLLLVELLRAVIGEHAHGGWLSALRDPVLRRALAAVHADPARPWSVPVLARRLQPRLQAQPVVLARAVALRSPGRPGGVAGRDQRTGGGAAAASTCAGSPKRSAAIARHSAGPATGVSCLSPAAPVVIRRWSRSVIRPGSVSSDTTRRRVNGDAGEVWW